MSNMSYCRFENTLNDLRDCIAALREEGMGTIESESERSAAEALYKIALKFRDTYEAAKGDEEAERLGLLPE
jgi:hypothetical protein